MADLICCRLIIYIIMSRMRFQFHFCSTKVHSSFKMTLVLTLFLASLVTAHSGLKSIVVDGTAYVPKTICKPSNDYSYPPFNSRIDNFLGPVRRIEWSHDIVETPFNPITNLSDPGLACMYLIFDV